MQEASRIKERKNNKKELMNKEKSKEVKEKEKINN